MSPRPSEPPPPNDDPLDDAPAGVEGCPRCAWLERRLRLALGSAEARARFILAVLERHGETHADGR